MWDGWVFCRFPSLIIGSHWPCCQPTWYEMHDLINTMPQQCKHQQQQTQTTKRVLRRDATEMEQNTHKNKPVLSIQLWPIEWWIRLSFRATMDCVTTQAIETHWHGAYTRMGRCGWFGCLNASVGVVELCTSAHGCGFAGGCRHGTITDACEGCCDAHTYTKCTV